MDKLGYGCNICGGSFEDHDDDPGAPCPVMPLDYFIEQLLELKQLLEENNRNIRFVNVYFNRQPVRYVTLQDDGSGMDNLDVQLLTHKFEKPR